MITLNRMIMREGLVMTIMMMMMMMMMTTTTIMMVTGVFITK